MTDSLPTLADLTITLKEFDAKLSDSLEFLKKSYTSSLESCTRSLVCYRQLKDKKAAKATRARIRSYRQKLVEIEERIARHNRLHGRENCMMTEQRRHRTGRN